ncbi:MAG TPA: glycosyltransferase family 9 protein [Pyrinomonadaceae bacterium]|nr:glycosyltransferase family 9 protein [Pyrinomonadaceae bacterium]
MNSLRDIVESSPRHRAVETGTAITLQADDEPQPLAPARWDWEAVQRVLVIRLRSIGDTVLSTPSLFALKRFLPHAQVDILVEDWVAPLLANHPHADNVIELERGGVIKRMNAARELRSARYDVVYNLHGGTTATFLARATGAPHRVGFKTYQYAKLHTVLAPSPLLLWGQQKTHSVEQQLALLGWTGVPVSDRPRTRLGIAPEAAGSVIRHLAAAGLADRKIALLHPAAAFATKRWATKNFARVAEYLAERGYAPVAIAAPNEAQIIDELVNEASVPILSLDLSLPEVSALASRSQLFIGNDSGIAHIAAAVGTPSVVIFGSSNIAHWRPWHRAAAEVVFEEMPCQPCHGYFCEKFPQPECILRVPVAKVIAAIERCLN